MARSSGTTFARWGTPPKPVALSEAAEGFLTASLGSPDPRPVAVPADVVVPKTRLRAEQRTQLQRIVSEAGVSETPGDRIGHSAGCSLTDYLHLRQADLDPESFVDAVVRPSSEADVAELLAYCANAGIAVVPFGGGTSVVGGVTGTGGKTRIAVAFDQMAEVVSVDEDSMIVTVQPGITGPVLERILGARGLTLGHLPQSWERATIGGYVATRSAGQASTGYGRSDEMVESLSVATPMGTLHLGRGPRSAAGPDLRQLFIGSEGALGIITEVSLRVRHLPTVSRYEGVMFPSYEAGVAAFHDLVQHRVAPDLMRLSDAPETEATLSMSGPQGTAGNLFDRYLRLRHVDGGCMTILGWEGTDRSFVKDRRAAAWRVLKKHGAVTLGAGVGETWRKHRYDGPYLRDTLLDRGYIVETMETATHWADVHALREAVGAALTGALARDGHTPYVMSHISHVYETGASLYFTVLSASEPDRVAQWARAKQAAGDAIAAQGATITHHHAVGRDHAPWLESEIGLEGVRILRGIKTIVDPRNVLNPGVLLPEG